MDWNQIEKILSVAFAASEPVLIYGPPGTGKSWTARNFKRAETEPYFPLQLTEDSSATEGRGYDRLSEGKFVFTEGPALRAWKEGRRLVIEEIEKTSGDMFSFLLGVLDDIRMASMLLPDGQVITPRKGFHAIATSNLTDLDQLPPALLDRFTVRVHVDEPHPNAIAELPKDLQKPAKNLKKLPLERYTSIRAFRSFANLRDSLGHELAATAIWGEKHGDQVLTHLKLATK